MSSISKKLLKAILKEDKTASGSVYVEEQEGNTAVVGGSLETTIPNVKDFISNFLNNEGYSFISMNLTEEKKFLSVSTSTGDLATNSSASTLDEVDVLFQGLVSIEIIKPNAQYKKLNFDSVEKVRAVYDVSGFLAPLVVDSNYTIVDGNLRYEVARRAGDKFVPVVVLNSAGKKTDLIRLATNRSSEFQRWIYSDVDEYVDAYPQLQPILEPLGFFGNKILPTTFFGNTVIQYRIDEYNDQMKEYSQDIGLANWAEHRREELLKKENAKKSIENLRKNIDKTTVSLFDLNFDEADFLPVHDIEADVRQHTLDMRDISGIITDNYDEIRKKDYESKGRDWQGTRRTSKAKAAQKRADAVNQDTE